MKADQGVMPDYPVLFSVDDLVNGVDISNNHPDDISMRLIEEVWERRHKEPITILKDY